MSQTLYRKYRPKNFSEIIGQTHIVRTLSNAVKNGRVGQAYLFTGPRGTGKTSLARILAKTANCLDLKDATSCEKCPSCDSINKNRTLDIIEIDAASNTGVDNIRELRETVSLPPTSLKFKVYIIDEAHMLSPGAFNALLKTLEEPPAHVIFVLATTEIHKVPETIISRCQRFDFARFPLEDIIKKLSLIAKQEKITVEKEVLEMIAIAAEGAMRDAESLFSQLISLEDKNITVKEAEEILGTTDRNFSLELAELIFEKKSTEAISKINRLSEEGYDLEIFIKSFLNYLRQLMLLSIDPQLKKHFSWEMPQEQLEKTLEIGRKTKLSEIIETINLFLEAKEKIWRAVIPQLPLEIAIIKATQNFPAPEDKKEEGGKYKEESLPHRQVPAGSGMPPEITAESRGKKSESCPPLAERQTGVAQSSDKIYDADSKNLTLEQIKEAWPKLLQDIKPLNHSLSILLLTCQIKGLLKNIVSLATPYEFYAERLNEAKNKLTIEEVFSNICGSKVTLKISIDKNLVPPEKEENPPPPENSGTQDSLLTDALEIMGGKVVE